MVRDKEANSNDQLQKEKCWSSFSEMPLMDVLALLEGSFFIFLIYAELHHGVTFSHILNHVQNFK